MCIHQKHNDLRSLSLTCKVFNELVFKALYETLDLQFIGIRDLHSVGCACQIHQEIWKGLKPRILYLLPKKLGKLLRTLRSRPDITSRIRYLRLPHKNHGPKPQAPSPSTSSSEINGDIYTSIFLRLFQIFKLCSARLRLVSGLGSLWSEPQHCFRSKTKLRSTVWKSITNNSSWVQWDFTEWSDTSLQGVKVVLFPMNISSFN